MSSDASALKLVPPESTVLALPSEPVKEVPAVPQEVTALVAKAKGFTIKDADLCREAKNLCLSMKAVKAKIEASRDAQLEPIKTYIDPFVKEMDRIKNRAGLALKLLTDNIGTLTHLIFDFEEKQRKAAAKEQAKINQKVEEKVAVQQAQAMATGAPMPVIPPVKIVTQPTKTEKFEDGSSLTIAVDHDFLIPGVADKEKLTREDQRGKDIPGKFFLLDWAGLRKVVRAGGGELIKGIVLTKKPNAIGRTGKDEE